MTLVQKSSFYDGIIVGKMIVPIVAKCYQESSKYDPCAKKISGEIIANKICLPNVAISFSMPVWLDGHVVFAFLMQGCRVMKQAKVKVAISQCRSACL